MENNFKVIIYSIGLGLCLGAIGVILMGYVAAIAIPVECILWFDSNEIANAIIYFISHFLAFGTLAIATGMILGRLSEMWILTSVVCYASFLFYLSIGTSLVYKTEISNPFAGFTYFDLPTILLLPLCLFVSTWIAAKKL